MYLLMVSGIKELTRKLDPPLALTDQTSYRYSPVLLDLVWNYSEKLFLPLTTL